MHSEDGPVNADFTVYTTIGAFTPSTTISIPCDEYGGYTRITGNGGTEVMSFKHDTSALPGDPNTKIYFNTPVYDKDGNEITGGGGGSKYIKDDSSMLFLGTGPSGERATSIFVTGPLLDKDGKEITGGGGGSKWITDGIDQGNTYLSLGRDENNYEVNSIFVCGPMYQKYLGASIEFIGGWNSGGILMNVASTAEGENTGLILNDTNSASRLALNPYLCYYYEGPCIGSYDNALALVGGKGGDVKIVARDNSGNEKYALINYDNIDKLINLLNS